MKNNFFNDMSNKEKKQDSSEINVVYTVDIQGNGAAQFID